MGDTRDYRGLQGLTGGYSILQEVTGGDKEFHGLTGGYKWLQEVTRDDKGLEWVTRRN